MHSIILLLVYFFLFTNNANAYLDPGTGSLIVQVILGTIASIATGFYIFWNKIKFISNKILGKIFKKKKENGKN